MGRPPKKLEEKRQIATFRLDPDDRENLAKRAKQSGRSLASEIESRVKATLALDAAGVDLVARIGAEIEAIQKQAKGKERWHNDLTLWSAVREMLRRGPIEEMKPSDWRNDPEANEAFKVFSVRAEERREHLKALAKVGINLPEEPYAVAFSTMAGRSGISGLGHALDPRRIMRQTLDSMSEGPERSLGLSMLDRLEELDAAVEEAKAEWLSHMDTWWASENEGRDIYRERLTEIARNKERDGEEYNPSHRHGIWGL